MAYAERTTEKRELVNKVSEVVRTNNRKAELVSQSSTAVQEVTDLRESIKRMFN